VEHVVRPAAGAGVPGGQPGRGEPGRGIDRAGAAGGIGEGRRRQLLAEGGQVVGGQPAQHRRQRGRGQVVLPAGRQHAQPLVARHGPEPGAALLIVPAQELLPGRHFHAADPNVASTAGCPSSKATYRSSRPEPREPR
jgi:hypothetical protein